MPRKKTSEAELLDVALSVFAEKGYHAASVSDIHQRAGVGRGTFYLYFPSKEAMFDRVLERALETARTFLRMRPDLLAELAARNMRNRSFTVLRQIVAAAIANRDAAALFLREAPVADARFAAKVDAFFDEAHRHLAAVFGHLVEQGWIAETLQPRVAATILIGTLKELVLQEVLCPSGTADGGEIVVSLVGLLLEGGAGPKLRDAWED